MLSLDEPQYTAPFNPGKEGDSKRKIAYSIFMAGDQIRMGQEE